MQSGIYEIVNTVNGKRYVGSAKHFGKRWSIHRNQLNKAAHHSRHLQGAWSKYGSDAFEFKVVLICAAKDLILYEQIVIDAFDPEYNVARVAGNTLGTKRSAETRARLSALAKGRKYSREVVEKRASKRRGVPLSPGHAAHLIGNKHAVGLKHTDEWKAANSARNMGLKRPKDAEYRAKIAATLTGRKATPEARANQSAAQLGKKRGPYRKRPPDPAGPSA